MQTGYRSELSELCGRVGLTMIRRNRKVVLYCVFAVCLMAFIAYLSSTASSSEDSSKDEPLACQVPDFDPYDHSVRHLISTGARVTCNGTPPLTYIDKQMLRINVTILHLHYNNDMSSCSYETIHREGNTSDNLFSYASPRRFTTDTHLKGEYLRVACYNHGGDLIYTNFHAAILRKPEVEARCNRVKYTSHIQEKLNVLLIGVDSVSRLNFMRQFTQTRQFLLHTLGAVELVGYNKVADNTYVNLVPMFTGKFLEELPWDERTHFDQPFDDYSFIWKNFSAHGYRTLYTEDAPHIAIFNYGKEGFHRPPADYYSRPYSLAMEQHAGLWQQGHDCAGTRLETERVLDYVRAFMTEFREDPFYAFAFITRLTHDDINKAGAADQPYFEFFKSSHQAGLLKNTAVIFFSDHGMRFGPIRETFTGQMEERLPFMYAVFPDWLYKKYPLLLTRLRDNARKLTTPFDIHATLSDIINFNHHDILLRPATLSRGISLFSTIPNSRSCQAAAIKSHWCSCRPWVMLPPSDLTIYQIVHHIVSKINIRVSHYQHLCAQLHADSIVDARTIVSSTQSDDSTIGLSEYFIIFRTVPGQGLFEVTVQTTRDLSQLALQGDISRINAYEGQADCMKVHSLRKFCYCN